MESKGRCFFFFSLSPSPSTIEKNIDIYMQEVSNICWFVGENDISKNTERIIEIMFRRYLLSPRLIILTFTITIKRSVIKIRGIELRKCCLFHSTWKNKKNLQQQI